MTGIDANKLKSRTEEIFQAWEARCRSEVVSAEGFETLALRDSLPAYLDHLAEALATNRSVDSWAVATAHGGTVSVESQQGSGTRFVLRFPHRLSYIPEERRASG